MFNVRLHSIIFQIVTFVLFHQTGAKIFEKCELARLFKNTYKLPMDQVANWVCIAQYQSRLDSSLRSGGPNNGAHGIFQISDEYWCSPPGNGLACGVSCDKLRDDNLADDLTCAQIIFAEHQRISGDGYNAWTTYQPFCKDRAYDIIQDCFDNDVNIKIDVKSLTAGHKSKGKVFERCELAHLLRNTHGLSVDEVANLVCIAQYQSGLDSSLITGSLNEGSHGLFQISDAYWCSSETGHGQGCAMTCDRLRDDDLTDDLACVRIIYDEHQRISGDGYNAWLTYQPFCRGKAHNSIRGCFTENELKKPASPISRRLQPKPVNFNRIDTIDNSLAIYETKDDRYYGKVYGRCELAQELYYKHNIPMNQIATWVCIVQHESNYNTSAVGRTNADGSEDHGLFQISDIYWCSPPGRGWVCGLPCSQLEDSDITDDVECMKTIYQEHEGISGDGFTAWTVYKPFCQGQSDPYIRGCFNEVVNNSIGNENHVSSSVKVTTKTASYAAAPRTRKKTGKIYTACELAQELKEKHGIPENEIATWVCIAKYESNFNTSALGYGDHGLFQISQIYWCSQSGRGQACEISCSDLKDDDITDDVQCIKKIYEEHTRLYGDGFNAWTVYHQFCNHGRAKKFIRNCEGISNEDFDDTTVSKIPTTKKPYTSVPKPIYTQPPATSQQTTKKQQINTSSIKQTTKPQFTTSSGTKPQSKSSTSSFIQTSLKKPGIPSKKPWWEHQSTQPRLSSRTVHFGVLYDSESSQIQNTLPSPTTFGTSSAFQRSSQYSYASSTRANTYSTTPSTKPGQFNKATIKTTLGYSTNKFQTKTTATPYKAATTTKSAHRKAFDVYFNLFNIPSPFEKSDKRSASYNSSPSNQKVTIQTATQRRPTTKSSLSSFSYSTNKITTTTKKPKTTTNQMRNLHSLATTKHSTKTTDTRTLIGATSTIVRGSRILSNGVKAHYFTISNQNPSHAVRSPRSSKHSFTHSIHDPPTQNPSLSKQIEAPLQDVDTTTKSS